MYLLKLYHQLDPLRPVAARALAQGRLRVGRDPTSDWVISDSDCEVSRTHLELVCSDDALIMTPLGANGVFGPDGDQFDYGKSRAFVPGDAICFGKYRMVVEEAPHAGKSCVDLDRTIAAPFGTNPDIPTAWPDPPCDNCAGDSLLDAFCRGADLDLSAFSEHDAADVMHRAGEIYRQVVLGLADLMSARSSVKRDHRLDRTTIGAEDNNPFKWAPSRRLASDLLLRDEPGFESGAKAVRSSFADIKKHMLGSLAGFHAAVGAVLEAGRPAVIEARVRREKSVLQSQAAACWAEFSRLHAELDAAAEQNGGGPIQAAFAAAYEARLRELEEER
ncbi:type VI secretion system-associated FHA domain protein TagH [Sphingosinicella sp. CPCC 101087]|uniref:type VI secretion system-associated FHA domain protein TagH n=1 Tax=Sphingosinicella sp. CPCC 101087 TaxID=2497754 RepID=UPI00101D0D5B|nr:type VI secretion system-associated FHA domain protein TagH [Sphingosinicella sp. CPCC 101087]